MDYAILASYEKELGAVVALGLAVGILHRWFWAGELEPDPWEQGEDSESAEDEEPICQRCLRPVSLLDGGCDQYGATTSPIAAFATIPAYLSLGDAIAVIAVPFSAAYIYSFFRNRENFAAA